MLWLTKHWGRVSQTEVKRYTSSILNWLQIRKNSSLYINGQIYKGNFQSTQHQYNLFKGSRIYIGHIWSQIRTTLNLQPPSYICYLQSISVTVETPTQTAPRPHQFPCSICGLLLNTHENLFYCLEILIDPFTETRLLPTAICPIEAFLPSFLPWGYSRNTSKTMQSVKVIFLNVTLCDLFVCCTLPSFHFLLLLPPALRMAPLWFITWPTKKDKQPFALP